MLSAPNLKEPRNVEEVVGLVDLLPTILDFLNLPPDPDLEGNSLRRLIEEGAAPSLYVFTESGYREDTQRVVRSKKWKLIWVPSSDDQGLMQGSEYELYDILSDPLETRNLADSEPTVVDMMKQILERRLKQERLSHRTRVESEDALDPASRKALIELGYVDGS